MQQSAGPAIAWGLIGLHRVVREHPRVHGWLVKLINESIGESRVNRTIIDRTRAGDVVWDIGANVGTYTRAFLDRVGPHGHVVAIEPVAENVALLSPLAPPARLTVVAAALAAADGEAGLSVSGEHGETSALVTDGAVRVRVARGDSLLRDGVPGPQVVKIDVEGFERDVLDGMPQVLRGARDIIIEVHFAAMARRGRPRDPLRLLERLQTGGFAVRWIDSSHLVATRADTRATR